MERQQIYWEDIEVEQEVKEEEAQADIPIVDNGGKRKGNAGNIPEV